MIADRRSDVDRLAVVAVTASSRSDTVRISLAHPGYPGASLQKLEV